MSSDRAGAPPPAARLGPAALARAFPFHVHLDAQLGVVAVGASLRKLLAALQPGAPLVSPF